MTSVSFSYQKHVLSKVRPRGQLEILKTDPRLVLNVSHNDSCNISLVISPTFLATFDKGLETLRGQIAFDSKG
jgi:hypothetical protein